MIRSSNDIIRDLLWRNVDFVRAEDGELAFTREGAHSRPRILFHEDITGKEITQSAKFSLTRVVSRPNVCEALQFYQPIRCWHNKKTYIAGFFCFVCLFYIIMNFFLFYLLAFFYHAPHFELPPQTLLLQLAQSRHPRVTQKVLLSAAAFLP
jgi:hypothetical protein